MGELGPTDGKTKVLIILKRTGDRRINIKQLHETGASVGDIQYLFDVKNYADVECVLVTRVKMERRCGLFLHDY
ncbi:hypothetical protein GCM10025859_18050 [Alicyclobacillus fastidiosus]|nr:hypothetical protein GCM10025859_18050 [Alicyclobacillus fastidiosus]